MKNPIAIDTKINKVYSIEQLPHKRSECLGKELKGKFELYPNTSKLRECIYISGPSGAGKTYFAIQYMKKYSQIYPDNKIVMFSNKPMEYEAPEHLHMKVTEDLFHNSLDTYTKSLVIFDDLENIVSGKDLQNKLMHLLEEMLNVGRSKEITVIIISHVMMNYRFTKNIILECNKVVMFPKSGSRYQYVNFMKTYLGFDSKQIDKILGTKSRWLVLDKECPLTTLTSNTIQVL